MTYIRGNSQPATVPALQARIIDLLKERESLKRTVEALALQIQALNAVPVNARRETPVCGTYSGYQRHIRDKKTPCLPCKAARAEYTRNYRKRQATSCTQ
ncbi:hypothetical protein J2T10_001974 [Paenarthrobacter nicotinovorans]|jgi:hypothetical protein|uniref:Uncharacterized protein n=1 Tax=Paenarthrobacter nicotinovorans TaxID=29320 RepID=A0ABT9TN68_PAENI|nr:hypothetical protein [Paenarthrobacter nicotinovorans]MDQ0102328.1 hypothetical protein [Paenarthrobacter nicotinovorans]